MESGADEILPRSKDEDVAFLVVGDPFGATTHTDLILRAKEKNIEVQKIKEQFLKLFSRNIKIIFCDLQKMFDKQYLRTLFFFFYLIGKSHTQFFNFDCSWLLWFAVVFIWGNNFNSILD